MVENGGPGHLISRHEGLTTYMYSNLFIHEITLQTFSIMEEQHIP